MVWWHDFPPGDESTENAGASTDVDLDIDNIDKLSSTDIKAVVDMIKSGEVGAGDPGNQLNAPGPHAPGNNDFLLPSIPPTPLPPANLPMGRPRMPGQGQMSPGHGQHPGQGQVRPGTQPGPPGSLSPFNLPAPASVRFPGPDFRG